MLEVEIGGQPILAHVVRLYARQGFRRFLLLAGYRADDIGAFAAATDWGRDVTVECVDTGLDTGGGGGTGNGTSNGSEGGSLDGSSGPGSIDPTFALPDADGDGGGCGCRGSGRTTPGWWLLLPLLASTVRRRRGRA